MLHGTGQPTKPMHDTARARLDGVHGLEVLQDVRRFEQLHAGIRVHKERDLELHSGPPHERVAIGGASRRRDERVPEAEGAELLAYWPHKR